MLQEISIKNFAIIENLQTNFDNGMTVLTGETGAGKSIIIDAVGLLAGGRGSIDHIRHGEKKTVLQGLFTMPKSLELRDLLKDNGIEIDDDQIIFERELARNGKNVARVNGHIVTVSVLRKLAAYLIDIHGQNEHQELMDTTTHVSLLDHFGDKELKDVLANYHRHYEHYLAAKNELEKLQLDEQQNSQRIDLLRFQINEIENAMLSNEDEEDKLFEERNILANYQRIQEELTLSYQLLQGEESQAIDQIGASMEALGKIQSFGSQYEELYKVISEAYYQLEDGASTLLNEIDDLSYDEERLNEVELRLEVLSQLKRKYGTSIQEIKAYYESIVVELDMIANKESYLEKLTTTFHKEKKTLLEVGEVLHDLRVKTAKRLEEAIHLQLKELYMEKASFQVTFLQASHKKEVIRPDGIDNIEFYISTNLGEPYKPLAKIASGGELSRMMLALKTIFTQTQEITSIIFDEVDTGVSGRVAQAIANKIHLVSKNSQVLCITHLPQVAAKADHHLYVEKEIINERTTTLINEITGDKRVNEVARMLAGTEVTNLSIAHAKELLELAEKAK